MLKYHIINLASCRLCPRRAAGGKERRYMDQNDKNKSNKNNDRRRGVLSLLIWALVLTIGFNYLLSAMDTRKLAESTCEIRYDEFLDLVRDGKVKEVEIADRTLNITPVDGFTYTDADGKTYSGRLTSSSPRRSTTPSCGRSWMKTAWSSASPTRRRPRISRSSCSTTSCPRR